MVGDKILRVNNIIFNNSKELQDILTTGNDFNILIERKSNKLPLSNFDNIADTSFGGDGKFQFS